MDLYIFKGSVSTKTNYLLSGENEEKTSKVAVVLLQCIFVFFAIKKKSC